ncbi:hypothetical protein HDU93_003591, partial [Gonapodya sp. JEL0774]
LVAALRPHNLTLPTLASILEQQVGGFSQTGAHGSGAAIAPADEYVVGLTVVTPEQGVLELNMEKDPRLFLLARSSLGTLGIAAHLTLQLVPAHKLVERSFATTPAHVSQMHTSWLAHSRHLRYHWIPHTDTVVVSAANVVGSEQAQWFEGTVPREARVPPDAVPAPFAERAEALLDLYRHLSPTNPTALPPLPADLDLSSPAPSSLTYTTLRDRLYSYAPLDVSHVRAVNAAVASYHQRTPVCRVDWSDKILGFDCGGQQWVCEVAFKAGVEVEDGVGVGYGLEGVGAGGTDAAGMDGATATTATATTGAASITSYVSSLLPWLATRATPPSCLSPTSLSLAASLPHPTRDLLFISDLYQLIHDHAIPAHEPLEQRWTAPSRSPMSVAHAGAWAGRPVFCWVGIMQYLPDLVWGDLANEKAREDITRSFTGWRRLCARHLWPAYGASEHWGKIEVPVDPQGRQSTALRVRDRFGKALVEEVGRWRGRLDPKNCLGNGDVDVLWPMVKV